MYTLWSVVLSRDPRIVAGWLRRLLKSEMKGVGVPDGTAKGNSGTKEERVEGRFSIPEKLHCTGSLVLAGISASLLTIWLGGKVALVILEMITGLRLNLDFGGDVTLIVFSIVFGGLGALIFALVGPLIPGSPTARGGYFGLVLFILLLPTIPESVQEEAMMLESHLPTAIALFGLVLMGFGVLLEPLQKLISIRKST